MALWGPLFEIDPNKGHLEVMCSMYMQSVINLDQYNEAKVWKLNRLKTDGHSQ